MRRSSGTTRGHKEGNHEPRHVLRGNQSLECMSKLGGSSGGREDPTRVTLRGEYITSHRDVATCAGRYVERSVSNADAPVFGAGYRSPIRSRETSLLREK